jgi:hypothetical protein
MSVVIGCLNPSLVAMTRHLRSPRLVTHLSHGHGGHRCLWLSPRTCLLIRITSIPRSGICVSDGSAKPCLPWVAFSRFSPPWSLRDRLLPGCKPSVLHLNSSALIDGIVGILRYTRQPAGEVIGSQSVGSVRVASLVRLNPTNVGFIPRMTELTDPPAL